MFKLVCVATKQLHNFRGLKREEKFDGHRVIHHAGNSSVKRLSSERCPNAHTKGKFGCRPLETEEVERQVVCPQLTLLIVLERIDAIE